MTVLILFKPDHSFNYAMYSNLKLSVFLSLYYKVLIIKYFTLSRKKQVNISLNTSKYFECLYF